MNTPKTAQPIIIARNVDKRYGSFYALRGVSASFTEGQVTAIVGPSGSGKSTFLRTLNRLETHDGGEIIIYAPHLDVVSHVHGKYIYEIGYHTLEYFLNDWERFKHIPLGVLAHSTHVRGSGVWLNGAEKPNVRVTLASQVPPEDCAKLNLGYLDPASINIAEWQNREDEGILYVPKAGEILYRLKK